MMDAIFVGITLAFFGLCALAVGRWIESLH